MNPFTHRALIAAMCASLLTTTALAQQYIYPAKGQSPDQQAAYGKARTACLEGRGYTVK